MNRMKAMVFIMVILVFGLVAPAMASTYLFQPEPTGMAALDASGNVNWSGLFASIERYKPGSNPGLYTHSPDTAAGGTSLFGALNDGNFFAGQGLSLDPWGNFSGTARYGNERVAAVVAALAGFLGEDHVNYSSIPDRYRSFKTLGVTCSPVPLPPSLWFLFSGLGLLGVARRRWWR
ncbi:MAG: VPLPA-CTERM sorting domain-containing protein [Pseudomonadota bacterium]|nr:VPLPA-CTERM sorting domain-containing protein [Pseudomonadota bacterium]